MARRYASLLCPTDLSPKGDAAVGVAYGLAGPRATVHLLHLYEQPYVLSPLDATPVIPLPWSVEQEEAHENKVRAHLRDLVPADASTRGVHTEIHVLRGAESGSVLLAQAARLGVDAVVMGTHGRSGLMRALMGSVAMDVVKHATVPVVLVHDPAIAGHASPD